MSDLISRSELIKAFNNKNVQITFDLPVEEVLGEDVDLDDFAMLVQDAIQAYKKMVIDTIKNQPTAYDIGNVVNVLESFVRLAEDRLVNGTSKYAYQERKCWVKAIEIVKQGGVRNNRKDCEYRHDNGNCLKVGGFCTSVDDKHCEKMKQGCEVSDDVCEWEKGSSGYVGYPAFYSKCCTTNSKGLEMQTNIIADWNYCPYCGKKIKAVE